MKANIIKTNHCKQKPICAFVQFYDNKGNYCEEFIEDVKPKDLPKAVIESFETNHDITLYVSPGDMVGVFAKDPQDIIDYVNCFYGTAGLQELLGKYTTDEMIRCTVTRLKKVSGVRKYSN